MTERPKAKIIQFPRKPTAIIEEPQSPLSELKELFKNNTEPKEENPKPRKPRETKPKQENFIPGVSILVSGGEGVKINNGHQTINKTVNHTTNHYHAPESVKPTVVVQTGVGVISAEQKRQLLDLRDKVVEASVVRKTPKTPASVMYALNKYMKVNKYDEIQAVDFDRAKAWLIKQAAITKSMASASKKMPNWRNTRISAIHSRCKECDFGEWRLAYMKEKFNKTSMVALSDEDLETLYRAVMRKK